MVFKRNAAAPPDKGKRVDYDLAAAFETHRGRLERFFLTRTRSAHVAEELTQEAFFRLTRHKAHDEIRDYGAFLFQVAINLIKDRARRNETSGGEHLSVEDDDVTQNSALIEELHPERVLQAKEEVITALTTAQLERYDLTSLEKISNSTPQMVIGRAATGSGAQLAIRGIGSNATSIGIEQSVAIIVDGVYFGQGRVINEGFFDLERVEILKGPQALFFGKNATAGVVSLTTASPSDRTEIIAKVGYEIRSHDLLGEFVASTPLTETLGLRIAVKASKMFDGYFDNRALPSTYTTLNRASGVSTMHVNGVPTDDSPGTKELIGRATLTWKPTDELTATLKVSGNSNKNNAPAWNYVPFFCPTGSSARNPAVKCGRDFVIYQNDLPEDIAATLPFGNGADLLNRYKSWQATGSIEYELDNITFTSVTNYNWNRNEYVCDCDFTSTSLPGTWGIEDTSFRAFSTEGRALTSFESPINLMVGFYYQKSRRKYDSAAIGGGFDNPGAADPSFQYLTNKKDSETKGETISGFGQVVWKVTPELEAAAGVRYTHETKDSYFEHVYASPFAPSFRPNVRFFADQTFNNWSPEATLTYQPSDNLTIYGGYHTAYKSGGFSNSGIISPTATVEDFTFEPEKAKGFDGGIKTVLFDRQLRANLAVYRYKYTNLQIDFFNSPIFAFSTINAGTAVTKGVEFNFEFAPRALSGFNLRGSLNYNRAKYGSFQNAPCYAGQSVAAGCTAGVPRPQQDLSGRPTALAPRWTATLGTGYEADLSSDLKLNLSVDARYSDDYLASAFGNTNAQQGNYVNLDAAARLIMNDGRLELAIIGKNLTNHFYVTGVFDGPLTGSGTGTAAAVVADQYGFAALPRTVQLQATLRY